MSFIARYVYTYEEFVFVTEAVCVSAAVEGAVCCSAFAVSFLHPLRKSDAIVLRCVTRVSVFLHRTLTRTSERHTCDG